jgi:glyoxylase-like metal-dependent hydrolase (beta-lactamase superfamily II)/rhodanese-related sulfurtransferase
MLFRQLFDPATSTYTYLLADDATREAVIIDPVKEEVERDCALLEELGLELKYAIDTHAHADHVTGAGLLARRTGAKTAISAAAGVACADVKLEDEQVLRFGEHELRVMHTPGHTNGCASYTIGDKVFTGDALLIRGSGRTDFQQGDAARLYQSVHEKIFTLPDDTRVFPGHDYNGRESSTVGEEKAHNPRLATDRSVEDFVGLMAALKLPYPKRIDVALPANMRCGLPEHEEKAEEPWAPIHQTFSNIPEVMPDWVAQTDVRIVDVREPMELLGELGAIERAENVPLQTLPQAIQSWDKDAPLVVLCRSGGRSGQAALILKKAGFKKVASMAGGMLRYRSERLPAAA